MAEDVEKVNPDLVVRDPDGKVRTVRYEQINAMLLNEFLKEHKTRQEQGATIARLEKQIEALRAAQDRTANSPEQSSSPLARSNFERGRLTVPPHERARVA